MRTAGLDPELIRPAQLQPQVDYADWQHVRATLRRAIRLSRRLRPPTDDLRITDQCIPARSSANSISVRVYEPPNRTELAPALVFCHGGAFTVGDLDTEDLRCREFARRTQVVVVSVDYRLAPEHPFPAGFEDCYDVVSWVASAGAELGIDPTRIAVGGSSAGGALAAAVALACRDLGGPALVLQLLLYPVLDERLVTASMRACTDTPGWNQPNSVHMWRHYLGGRADPSPYAAPARASDLAGLPRAYVLTVEFDPLRDEGIEYARRLMAAGVPTELHNLPGAFHGFDAAAPEAALSRRALTEQCATLARHTGSILDPEPAAL